MNCTAPPSVAEASLIEISDAGGTVPTTNVTPVASYWTEYSTPSVVAPSTVLNTPVREPASTILKLLPSAGVNPLAVTMRSVPARAAVPSTWSCPKPVPGAVPAMRT